MTYGIGIGFPMEPTKEDIKKLKRSWPVICSGWWTVEGQNQSQQVAQIQVEIKQNPPVKRIEVHPIHQKLVVRDLKTGQYVNKR